MKQENTSRLVVRLTSSFTTRKELSAESASHGRDEQGTIHGLVWNAGISQEFHRNPFNFTGKTQESENFPLFQIAATGAYKLRKFGGLQTGPCPLLALQICGVFRSFFNTCVGIVDLQWLSKRSINLPKTCPAAACF